MLKKIFKYFFLFLGGSIALVMLIIAVSIAIIAYGHYFPDKYEYWNDLIAKDPKPMWTSEKEYREKLRAGYCWRDRKFYKPEELQQNAMVGFAGRLLGEVTAYGSDSTKLQGQTNYTGADCTRNKEHKACSVWFSTHGYTNAQWDKLLLAEKDPADSGFLAQYMNREVKQPDDLNGYIADSGNKGFSLISRDYDENGATIYGSDCCKVLSKKEAEPKIKNNKLISHNEIGLSVFPENHIPKDIRIEDFGVGNFYLEFRKTIPGLYQWDESKEKTYQSDFSRILLMNNCGDVLWQPYYIN
ncbi:hypothetical protein [Neisseria sp.]|uniref:hypothetical protein n=1 Tax=Neisseria sp. TaxID=192066 RepID=UPI0035A0140F